MTASSAHSPCSIEKFTYSPHSTQIQLPSTCFCFFGDIKRLWKRKTWQQVAELQCVKMVLTRGWCDNVASGSSKLAIKRNPRLTGRKHENNMTQFRTTLNLDARSCVSVCENSSDKQPGKREGLRGPTLTFARQDENIPS